MPYFSNNNNNNFINNKIWYMKEESNQSPDGDYVFLYVVSQFPSSKLTVGEQDSEVSMYWWYRNNTNFNFLNMLTTMFKQMVFVDTSIINAKQRKNALKGTENFIFRLKAPHSISMLEWVHFGVT